MLQPDEDLTLLLTAAWSAANEGVLRRLEADGFGDLRPSHGYVFQHLVPGPLQEHPERDREVGPVVDDEDSVRHVLRYWDRAVRVQPYVRPVSRRMT